MEAEFGAPQWVFGTSTYGFVNRPPSDDRLPSRGSGHPTFAVAPDWKGTILCAYHQPSGWRLGLLDGSGRLEPLDTPYTSVGYLRTAEGRAVFVGVSPAEPPAVVELDVASRQTRVLRRSSEVRFDPGYLSPPQALEFPTEKGLTAHGFFYSPRNRDFQGPTGERPPLLVISHGGPTSATTTGLNASVQFWTSRGFAVLDVNYGGSTGYGRPYRERLNGQWGVVDVDDCVNGARCLVARGEVDAEQLAIRGGSAGGYTTLAALTFRDCFRAGASHYGVSDLEALAKETHKFESRYLDRLIGPYPERRDLYLERSPLHQVHRLSTPMIFFQGLEDLVVPANQAELMVEALRQKGVPVAYLAFEGEQHGFRRAETIKRALEAELYFYSRIFGFEMADPVEPVRIENL